MEELRSRVGPLATKHWAIRLARETQDEAALVTRTTNTFRQCIYLDGERRTLDRRAGEQQAASETYISVHSLINGVRVPLLLDIEELRKGLGLPNFNLLGLGQMDTDEPSGPTVDMEDIDHLDSDNE